MRFLSILIVAVFAVSCANQVAPTGGDKDTTPPKLLRVVPENGTTQFQYSGITFEFDEFVDVRLPNPSFSITPEWPEQPKLTVKKRLVTLSVPDSLLPNTTYTINFGRALVDINEGNVLEDLTYAFSTGPYIDSMQLSGQLILSYTGENPKDYSVGLFVQQKDSILLYSKPLYTTKSNQNGTFSFSYLPEKAFYLLAWNDGNNDRMISYGEMFGFTDSQVVPQADLGSYELQIGTQLYRTTAPVIQPINNRKFAITGKPGETWPIESDSSTGFSIEYVNDTSYLYLPYNLEDSLAITVSSADTSWQLVLKPRYGKNVGDTFDCPTPAIQMSNGLPVVVMTFPFPIQTSNQGESGITWRTGDSLRQVVQIDGRMLLQAFEDTHWGDTVTLALLQGAITNAMGQSSAIDTFTVVIPKKEDVGSVTITIDDTFIATPHLISLFDNLNRLILQCNSCATLSAAALLPGNYHIEIIEDRNNNGRWDEGDFLRGLQPERRYWRKDAVQIKPNWDITIEVKP